MHQLRANTRAKRLRRRGIRAGEPISLLDIARRDRWRCQLCRGRVPHRLAVPHPRAATLDHIVPITEGGRHERSNVQLAHFECNTRKGTATCGSQLRLVG